MQEPKLTVAVAERGGRTVLLVSRNDSGLFNLVDWELGQLAALGELGAQAHVGATVLKMLARAHPDSFAPYPALVPDPALASPDEAVSYLLHSSIQQRTSAYVGAIDALLEHHGDAISAVQREHWPYMRARILRDYAG